MGLLDALGRGWTNLVNNVEGAPPESWQALGTALASHKDLGQGLAAGIGAFQQRSIDNIKRKGLASAFDSMAAELPESQRAMFQQMVQNDPQAMMSVAAQRMFSKPSEAWKPVDIDGDGRNDFQQSSITGEYKDMPKTLSEEEKLRRAGASSTTVNVGGSEKQIFDAVQSRYEKVAPIVGGMNSLREARKLVNSGGVFGAGADIRVGASKVLSLLTGKPVDPAVVNTESFRAAIAPLVGATLKATSGTSQLSEGELKFAERASAGDINLDPASIKRVLDILEKAMNNTVRDYNRQLDFVYPKGAADRTRGLFELNLAPPAAPGELTYNPATGRAE